MCFSTFLPNLLFGRTRFLFAARLPLAKLFFGIKRTPAYRRSSAYILKSSSAAAGPEHSNEESGSIRADPRIRPWAHTSTCKRPPLFYDTAADFCRPAPHTLACQHYTRDTDAIQGRILWSARWKIITPLSPSSRYRTSSWKNCAVVLQMIYTPQAVGDTVGHENTSSQIQGVMPSGLPPREYMIAFISPSSSCHL